MKRETKSWRRPESVHRCQAVLLRRAEKALLPTLGKLLNEKSTKKFGKIFTELNSEQKTSMYYEIVESSARPDARFNTLNKALRVSGKVLIVVTITYATYEIINADNKPKEAIKQGITIAGGAAGTRSAGLAVSTVCGPGAPFCAIGLMLAAGVTSGWVASKLADSMDDGDRRVYQVENQLEQRKLWSALSDLFVDAKVDYKQIAEALKDFSIEEIEFALFERVAPVCIGNMLAPSLPFGGTSTKTN